jgi:hypothetical protein
MPPQQGSRSTNSVPYLHFHDISLDHTPYNWRVATRP